MGLRKYLQIRKAKKFKKKYRIGLCLSGGGTRGFAHLGAFKAFEEYGIKFNAVAGTSAGSLFGALYACGLDFCKMDELTCDIKETEIRKARLGFLPTSTEKFVNLINERLPIKKIENLRIPFYVVAVNLKTGKEVHFDKGDIASIVAASSAVPGVFLPVKYHDMNLVDGGVRNNIPADVLKKKGCDFVITIDLNSTRGGGTKSEHTMPQIMAAIGIMMINNSRTGILNSDLVIRPNLQKFKSSKLNNRKEMIEEGYNAVVRALPEIAKLFSGKYPKKKLVDIYGE